MKNSATATMAYDISEHRHRFSVWAAARATQRGFARVDVLRDALEQCGVREFLLSPDAFQTDEDHFRVLHNAWCRSIVQFLEGTHPNVSFGRAAKLIAVYLKSMVVLARPETSLARVAHPPIDAILLNNIGHASNVLSPHKRLWRRVKWTQLQEEAYYAVVKQLRETVGAEEPFWKLEQFWTVTDDSNTVD